MAYLPTKGVRPPGSGSEAERPEVQARYRAMRQAILAVLPKEAPGLTAAELTRLVEARLPAGLFPAGSGFYLMAVKAHLQSIGLLLVEERRGPERFLRGRNMDFA